MVHAAEVLERLVRDVKIVIKNFSLVPTDNLHAILGDEADWKSESGSLSPTKANRGTPRWVPRPSRAP